MKYFLMILLGGFMATTTQSLANDITSGTTGEYENNANLSKILKIDKKFSKRKHYFMLTNKDYTDEITENYYIKPTKDDYPDMPDNAEINLEYFDISTNQWKKIELHKNRFTTYLAPGEGKLFRFNFSPIIVQ